MYVVDVATNVVSSDYCVVAEVPSEVSCGLNKAPSYISGLSTAGDVLGGKLSDATHHEDYSLVLIADKVVCAVTDNSTSVVVKDGANLVATRNIPTHGYSSGAKCDSA